MKITVFGSGYVGLVTGACLADVGNQVICMDIDQHKIGQLNQGIIPIYEPGLEEMIKSNMESGRLRFTTDVKEAVDFGLFQFIAVGTPPDEDGSADLRYVLAVAENIAEHLNDYKIIVNKSTVPVGTADKVKQTVNEVLAQRGEILEFDVVSNPEFLKEGSALEDFMKPDRIIIGSDNPRTSELLKALYAPFNRSRERIIIMDIRSAELTKYAANAMLATKISFMNELANLAELVGADIEYVRHGIGSDSRIGYSFIYPGCGYGGSCFPKDVKALERTAREMGYQAELLSAVENVNNRQKRRLFEKIISHYPEGPQGKIFALWGLAFKPNTNDMRDAPSRAILEALIDAGATVQAYDPEALKEAQAIYSDKFGLKFCSKQDDTLIDADALIICTEWKQFRSPDFDRLSNLLKDKVIFDGRNMYSPKLVRQSGLLHYSIGR
ncbi:UDP-glucose dehydrogenase family protein [Candidatus Methylomicrobium oryzae]|jgi:UDPglucose 6-dehydrogenase|uniref:UDP-glucose dehydrogenase family protein n=1 Tax=Candidatus Methylomicrobium oryzae TaxID=2802053 RepID=UPI00192301A1|nr:UDP-glucose/GDP-mannose dehydrogenase family protein [Methylomicrobium sp. RS1]MBL1264137.1 UDP-glucose/GDP-mannose dehydrogenase family protein [Methylomicrobium sp. RS1]